mmetsp:Transcript_83588/g.210587  ORF Transcript_83588/g.210587 Transcript_83588/m.210587 type:complete len:244 (-) Transcript_83588:34-765(-)
MVGYRLYRGAVACAAGGRVGEALTRQLLLSPLCSEVVAVGSLDRREFESLSASAKLRQLGGPSGEAAPSRVSAADEAAGSGQGGGLEGVDAAFCVLGDGRLAAAPDVEEARRFAELCREARVRHVSLLSTLWGDASSSLTPARQHGEIAEIFAASGFERLSIFLPSLVTLPGGFPEDAALPERLFYHGFPVARQFMPTRYREVSLADTVLAMRLNVELCDSAEKVERLHFMDMMAIIGKEDSV